MIVGALAAPGVLPLACGGSSSVDTAPPAGSGAPDGGGGASSGGASQGGFGATAAGQGGLGAATAAGQGGVGGALLGVDGGSCGTTQCTDCLDNDGDGLSDGFDPDCTGYLDNDEGSFATGIPGDNIDPCKQDCFFDGNSGQGDDKCEWNLACDPKSPGAALGCPYDPKAKNCPGPPSQACLDKCLGSVPNGCDCFGCCAFQTAAGTKSVLLLPTCDSKSLDDPTKCPPCTQSTQCGNPCDPCELCLGKNELPKECQGASGAAGASGSGGAAGAGAAGTSAGGAPAGPQCPAGAVSCTQAQPCAAGYYCLTGCCQIIVE